MAEFALTTLSALLTVWVLYVLLPPVLAAFRRTGEKGASGSRSIDRPRIAVIVPAHNMEQYIQRCIDSIKACGYPRDLLDIFVVADHCDDRTADLARVAGAEVLVRTEEPRGKTYTLAWAFEALAARESDPDMYVVVDATARVEAGFLDALAARLREGEDIVVGRATLDLENQKWFARCLGLTLAHRNLQNWARERLGLSAFISGRGMAYSRGYIQRHGWRLATPTGTGSGSHPTEDWRHGVRAVEEGYRVAAEPGARVFTPLRGSLRAATQQGVRWERGRILNSGTHALRLLTLGLRQRSRMKIIAALDAVQPPVAVLAAACVLVALLHVMVLGRSGEMPVGFLPLVFFGIYGVAVIAQGRREGIGIRTVLWAPVYILWRCGAFVVALVSMDQLVRRKADKPT